MTTRDRVYTQILLLMAMAVLMAGCSSLRSLSSPLFTRATLADLEIEGMAGAQTAVTAAHLAAVGALSLPSDSLVQIADPVALRASQAPSPALVSLLPVHVLGETVPRLVVCGGQFAEIAGKIPVHARVRVWGETLGNTGLILPSRIVCRDCED